MYTLADIIIVRLLLLFLVVVGLAAFGIILLRGYFADRWLEAARRERRARLRFRPEQEWFPPISSFRS